MSTSRGCQSDFSKICMRGLRLTTYLPLSGRAGVPQSKGRQHPHHQTGVGLCNYGAVLFTVLAPAGSQRQPSNIPTTSINRIIKNSLYIGVLCNGESRSEQILKRDWPLVFSGTSLRIRGFDRLCIMLCALSNKRFATLP